MSESSSNPSRPGVIFDVDGVLVDSRAAHFRAWRDVAAEAGIDIDDAAFDRAFGRTSRDIIIAWWTEAGRSDELDDETIAAIDEEKERRYRDLLEDGVTPVPGAPRLVADLARAGFLLGVGSSGPPANVDLVLDRLGIADHLPVRVTGVDVTRGKPDPEVFMLASRRLGLDRSRGAVIEDAPAGIAAARAAGLFAIGLVTPVHPRASLEHAGADRILDGLADAGPDEIIAWLDARAR